MFSRKKQIGDILVKIKEMKTSIIGIDARLLKLSEQFDNHISQNQKRKMSGNLMKSVYPPAQPGGEAAGSQQSTK